MSNIKLFMLPGGVEVIGDAVAEALDSYSIKHPLIVRPVQQAAGQYMLDLYPYSITNPEGTHTFRISVMVSESKEVPEMLSNAYTERTSAIILSGAVDAFAQLSK